MTQTARIYRIQQWLLNPGAPVTFASMQQRLEVSPATLKRDLAYMRDQLQVPVEYDRLGGGYTIRHQRVGDRVEVEFRLWNQTRPGDPLVLSQPGALTAVGDTLVAGLAGRLAGLNPDNGAVRWEVPVATGRGTNEVERLVDILGPASRIGASVCVRAYSAAVGCVDAERGSVVWTRQTSGLTGVHGDDRQLYGSDGEGRLQAFNRASGQPAWTVERLKYRQLSAPLALGRVVAFGDNSGLVHLVSREDGSEMTRLTTDGSPIVVAPVLAGDALVVQTRNGGLYAWRPQ